MKEAQGYRPSRAQGVAVLSELMPDLSRHVSLPGTKRFPPTVEPLISFMCYSRRLPPDNLLVQLLFLSHCTQVSPNLPSKVVSGFWSPPSGHTSTLLYSPDGRMATPRTGGLHCHKPVLPHMPGAASCCSAWERAEATYCQVSGSARGG